MEPIVLDADGITNCEQVYRSILYFVEKAGAKVFDISYADRELTCRVNSVCVRFLVWKDHWSDDEIFFEVGYDLSKGNILHGRIAVTNWNHWIASVSEAMKVLQTVVIYENRKGATYSLPFSDQHVFHTERSEYIEFFEKIGVGDHVYVLSDRLDKDHVLAEHRPLGCANLTKYKGVVERIDDGMFSVRLNKETKGVSVLQVHEQQLMLDYGRESLDLACVREKLIP